MCSLASLIFLDKIVSYTTLNGAIFASKGANFALDVVEIVKFSRLVSLGDNFLRQFLWYICRAPMTISLPPSEPKTWVHACKLSDPIPFCARAFKTKMSCKSQTKNEDETKDNSVSSENEPNVPVSNKQ